MLARFGTAKAALKNLPRLAIRHSAADIPSRSHIEVEWTKTVELGAQLLCAQETEFPSLLKRLDPPPPVLTARGDTDLAQRRTIAIVGSRQASAIGRKLSRDLARDLAQAGFTIVSGLARGIDGEAHAASLETGTIAVLGGGIDHIYPPQHERLYDAIAQSGLILSESPFGHRATARDFPRRNRIVTGLCEGVIVVEAAERSGSLISARTALEQNREVFAVPGSPIDPRHAGTNRLLREGATLIRHAEDVIEALSPHSHQFMKAPEPPSFEYERGSLDVIPQTQIAAVEAALSYTPTMISDVASAADIGVQRCATILVELELAGIAITLPGGLAALAPPEATP